MNTVYLAGFDVFRADAEAHGDRLKRLCRKYGFAGLYPLDNAAPANLSGRVLAQWIYTANIELIHRADAVMANLNAFRGAEPDSGTVFEVGYATALKKAVWVYTDQSGALVDQVAVEYQPESDRHIDKAGFTVEDFGLNLNLMIACGTHVVVGSAEDCLRSMRADALSS